jgi:hypothetical protein
MLELKAAPNKEGRTTIKYSTDGSNPSVAGGVYVEPVRIVRGTTLVQAIAIFDDITSETQQIPIEWDIEDGRHEIDPDRQLVWHHAHELHTTMESYAFLERLANVAAGASGIKLSVTGTRWAELNLQKGIILDTAGLRAAADLMRRLTSDGQLGIDVAAIHFARGQGFLDWVTEARIQINYHEVKQ